MLDLHFWTGLVARLGIGSAAILALTMLLCRAQRRARAQRGLWQAALAALALLYLGEASGLSTAFVAKHDDALRKPSTPQVIAVASKQVSPAPNARDLSRSQTALPQSQPIIPHSVVWPAILAVGGTIVLLLRTCFQTLLCLVIRLRSQTDAENRWGARSAEMGGHATVRIYRSKHFATPVAFGIWSPALGLPLEFEQEFSAAEQEAIIAHELAHLSNHDPLWRLLADLLAAISWWNPASWIAWRNFLNACEWVADEGSAEMGGGGIVLAEVLVKLGRKLSREQAGNWSAMAGSGYKSSLGRRVQRLMDYRAGMGLRKGRFQTLATAGAGLIMAGCAFAGVAILEQRLSASSVAEPRRSPIAVLIENLRPRGADGPTVRPQTIRSEVPGRAPEPRVAAEHQPETPAAEKEKESTPGTAINGQSSRTGTLGPLAKTEPERSPQSDKPAGPRESNVTRVAAVAIEARGHAEGGTNGTAAPKSSGLGRRVQVDAKWIEVSGGSLEQVGWNTLFPNLVVEESVGSDAIRHALSANARVVTTQPGGVRLTNEIEGARVLPMEAILSQNDYDETLKSLEQRGGVDVLSSPRLLVASGREGQISITTVKTIVTDVNRASDGTGTPGLRYTTETIQCGPTLNVIPEVQGSNSVRLRIAGQTFEFLGYDDPEKADHIRVLENGKKIQGKVPLPRFHSRQFKAETQIGNGDALVLGGIFTPERIRMSSKVPILGDIPMVGRLFRSQSEGTITKHLILIVRAKIVEE